MPPKGSHHTTHAPTSPLISFYDDLKSGSTGGAGGGAGSGSSASGAIPDRETASTMVDSVVTTTVDSGMLEGDVADITKAIVDTLELAGVAGDPTVAAKVSCCRRLAQIIPRKTFRSPRFPYYTPNTGSSGQGHEWTAGCRDADWREGCSGAG